MVFVGSQAILPANSATWGWSVPEASRAHPLHRARHCISPIKTCTANQGRESPSSVPFMETFRSQGWQWAAGPALPAFS